MLDNIRFKSVDFGDKSWTVDEDGRMFFKSFFTSDNPDKIGDIITRDATERAIEEWRKWSNIRLQHDPTKPVGRALRIGLHDGLEWNEMEGLISTDEAKQLVRDGVIHAMSVGIIVLDFEEIDFDEIDFDVSPLAKISWWPPLKITDYMMVEVSLVDNPMNDDAVFSGGEKYKSVLSSRMTPEHWVELEKRVDERVKSLGCPHPFKRNALPFQNYDVVDLAFDDEAAIERVARWASSDGSGDKDKIDYERYRKAFVWHDATNQSSPDGYKGIVADVFNGGLKVVKRGLAAVESGLDEYPEQDREDIKRVLDRYTRKYGDNQPPSEVEMEMKDKNEQESIDKEVELEQLESEEMEQGSPESEETPAEDKSVEAEDENVDSEDQEDVESDEQEESEEVEQDGKSLDDRISAIEEKLAEVDDTLKAIYDFMEKSAQVDEQESEEAEQEEADNDEKEASLEVDLKKLVNDAVEQKFADLKQIQTRKSVVPSLDEPVQPKDEKPENLMSLSLNDIKAEIKSILDQKFQAR